MSIIERLRGKFGKMKLQNSVKAKKVFADGIMDWDEFAQALGYTDRHELWDKMEKIFAEGDVGWYIAPLPDGKWVAFDDSELALDRVEYFNSQEEAKKYLEEVWAETKEGEKMENKKEKQIISREKYRAYLKRLIKKALYSVPIDITMDFFNLGKQVAREVFQPGSINIDPSDTNALWDLAGQYWPDIEASIKMDFQSGFSDEMERLLQENKTSSKKVTVGSKRTLAYDSSMRNRTVKKADYNGWSNWETWNAFTQITSFDDSYQLALQATDAEDLQRMFPDIRRSVERNYSSDLTEQELWGDISQINWQELYQGIVGEEVATSNKPSKTSAKTHTVYLKTKPSQRVLSSAVSKKAQDEETNVNPEGKTPNAPTHSEDDFFNFLDALKNSEEWDNLTADDIVQKLVDAFGITSEEAHSVLERYENREEPEETEETPEEKPNVEEAIKKAQVAEAVRKAVKAGIISESEANNKVEELSKLNQDALQTVLEVLERSSERRRTARPVISLGKIEPDSVNEYSKLFEEGRKK